MVEKLAKLHVEKIIFGGSEFLDECLSEIKKMDEIITEISNTISLYQSDFFAKSLILKNENGYWYFLKPVAIQSTKEYKEKHNKPFWYKYNRISLEHIDKYFNKEFTDINSTQFKSKMKIKKLVLSSKKLIQQRNNLLSKIALALGGLKRIKIDSTIYKKIRNEINIINN